MEDILNKVTKDSSKNDNSILIMSLPRSGSTWFSKRLSSIYGYTTMNEPFRVIFGSKHSNPIHNLRVPETKSILSKEYLKGIKHGNLKYIFKFLNNTRRLIIKETSLLTQIDYLKENMPDIRVIILLRNPVSIFYSHIRITNVFEIWNYEQRITRARSYFESSNQSELSEYYSRAETEEIRGSKNLAMLFAHLFANNEYLQNRKEEKIYYEDLVGIDGVSSIKSNSIFSKMKIEDEKGFTLDMEEKQDYKIHGTKNPINPTAWIESFSEEDFLVMSRIIGKDIRKFYGVENVKNQDNLIEAVPKFTYPDLEVSNLSNRPVTIGEFCHFLNYLTKNGVEDPHEILCFNASYHTINFYNGYYTPRKPNAPIILISPLAALAYAFYKGEKLPTIEEYKNAAEKLSKYEPLLNTLNCNYSESIGGPTRPGKYQDLDGFFDLFGNVREMATNGDGDVFAVGGSYNDEKEDLSLSQLTLLPKIGRDLDIGFRISKSNNIQDSNTIISLISEKTNSLELYDKIYSLMYK